MEIPSFLLDQIREGRTVLVLGAGASREATSSKGIQPPVGPELAQIIADKFLGGLHRLRGRRIGLDRFCQAIAVACLRFWCLKAQAKG